MFRSRLFIALTFTVLSACQTSTSVTPSVTSPSTQQNPGQTSPTGTSDLAVDELKKSFLSNYALNVYTNYQDAHGQAVLMQTAINDFLQSPDASKLDTAKKAWLTARKPYGQTEGFRFYDGPIDNENGPEGQLNAWPMDEVFVDYVEGESDGGIVNQPQMHPEINADLLKSLNEKGGDKNISTGYHAIEFLLWGQDLSVGAGAGQRSFTDYTTAANADRRGQYLKTVTDLLVSDLKSLVDAWAPEQDNYRKSFLALDPLAAIGKVLKGVGTLSASELSAERMGTPLDIGDREEEHSCFSDNTRNDIVYNAQSIQNVLMGHYTTTEGNKNEGTSLIALIQATNPELAEKLTQSSEKTLALTRAIKDPFDQEIRAENEAGKARIRTAINELQTQGRLIVEAGQVLGVKINTDL